MPPKKRTHAEATAASPADSAGGGEASNAATTTPGADDAGKPPRKKAEKKAVSCKSCRRRKLKCDRGWPCGACRDRGEADLCEWEGGTKPATVGPVRDLGISPPTLARLDRIETFLESIAARMGVEAPPPLDPNLRGAVFTANSRRPMTRSIWAFPLATTLPHKRELISQGIRLLPVPETMRRISAFYLSDVAFSHWCFPHDAWWSERLPKLELMRTRMSEATYPVPNGEDVADALRTVAMALAMVGHSLLFGPIDQFPDVVAAIGDTAAQPIHAIFFDAAQAVLDASHPLEDAHLGGLQASMMLGWSVATMRGMSSGHVSSIMAGLVHQAFYLGLDTEPDLSVGFAQAQLRLMFFWQLCVWDWQMVSSRGGTYILREEPHKQPYLFGPPGSSPWHDVETAQGKLISEEKLVTLKAANMGRRQTDRRGMSPDDALRTTREIYAEFTAMRSSLPPALLGDIDVPVRGPTFANRRSFNFLLDLQLLNLWKDYYLRGWVEPDLHVARDQCVEASMRLIKRFHKSLDAQSPGVLAAAAKDNIERVQGFFEKKREGTARYWFSVFAAVSAIFLLQEHLEQMQIHMAELGPSGEAQHAEISQLCAITRRLLVGLSLRSQPAHVVVSQMQQAAAMPRPPGTLIGAHLQGPGRGPTTLGLAASPTSVNASTPQSSSNNNSAPLELLAGVSSDVRNRFDAAQSGSHFDLGMAPLHAGPQQSISQQLQQRPAQPGASGNDAFDVDSFFKHLFGPPAGAPTDNHIGRVVADHIVDFRPATPLGGGTGTSTPNLNFNDWYLAPSAPLNFASGSQANEAGPSSLNWQSHAAQQQQQQQQHTPASSHTAPSPAGTTATPGMPQTPGYPTGLMHFASPLGESASGYGQQQQQQQGRAYPDSGMRQPGI